VAETKEFVRDGPARCATCPAWTGCQDNPEYRAPRTPDGIPADVAEKKPDAVVHMCTLNPTWVQKASFEWCMNHPDNVELMGGFDEDEDDEEEEDDEEDEDDEDEEEDLDEEEEVEEVVRRHRRRKT
jgi:hypothetical protein